jgi:hypothetical protein
MLNISISYKLSIEKKTRSEEVMDIMNVYVYEKINQYKKEEFKSKVNCMHSDYIINQRKNTFVQYKKIIRSILHLKPNH